MEEFLLLMMDPASKVKTQLNIVRSLTRFSTMRFKVAQWRKKAA
jgi:hypothetical protein